MSDIDTTTRLADLFAANRQREWYFVNAGGNWGDSMIAAGAESVARKAGLCWTDLDYNSIAATPPPAGAAIYLHGGGGYNAWYKGRAFANLRRAVGVRDALVIQGPQTCETESDEVRRFFASTLDCLNAAEIHFFAREQQSARYLLDKLPIAIKLHLAQDTAFELPLDELLALSDLRRIPHGRYCLFVVRDDVEASSNASAGAGRGIQMDPAYFAQTFRQWLRIHAKASRIITNRLHSAIAGSLFNKPVELLPCIYHKNRSVWEFSLRERGVVWRDALEGKRLPEISKEWLPKRIVNSWKVTHFLYWLRGVPLK